MKAELIDRQAKVPSAESVVNPVVLLTAVFILTVLLLHHGSYTHDYIWRLRQFEVNKYLQKLAVGGFLFLSGYKLTLAKSTTRMKAFWWRRFIRVYPPYFLALLAYSFTDYVYRQESFPSIGNFLLHAGLLQAVLPNLLGESYRTLWFVSLLFCCYVFFLSTRRIVTRERLYAAVAVLSVVVICNLRNFFAGRGIDLFLQAFEVYLLFFASGMLYSAHQQKVNALIRQNVSLSKRLVAGGVLLLAIVKLGAMGLGATDHPNFYYFDVVASLATTIPLYLLFLSGAVELCIRRNVLFQSLQWISAASFFIYLFHRPIWSVLASVWPGSGFVHSLYVCLVGLPLIFAFSYWGQMAYSTLVKRW